MGVEDWPREQRFEVTEDHLKLLRHLEFEYTDDVEFGAPAVDPKRPYGNGDVYADMRKILGREPADDDDLLGGDDMPELLALHKEMATVLQIIARTGQVKVGVYDARKYIDDWQEVA